MESEMVELLSSLTDARRAHSIEVGRKVESMADSLPVEIRSMTISAAYLHDVGYGHPVIGFHPIDGANLLRERGYPDCVCHIVAFHSASVVEAEVRELDRALFDPFQTLDVPGIAQANDLVWWADMTTGPNGETFTFDERLSEIRSRYEKGSIVHTAIDRAEPLLRAAVQRASGSM
ncbi:MULTISPECIES: HD domain-containing protein [unclassified Nocardia]|uniref:HD domain-containing protein n=1 Tax=unclassified Nocardia TaxID=2637762 RepID=UPI001CE3D93D|nr:MULTISPECIES: HD domain-containing protein [unclassified Nocardia]